MFDVYGGALEILILEKSRQGKKFNRLQINDFIARRIWRDFV